MRRLLFYRFRRTTLQLLLLLSILAGIGLARTGPGFGLFPVSLLVPFLVFAYPKQQSLSAILVIIFGLSLGWWRGAIYMGKLAAYEPIYYQKVTLVAKASEDGTYGKHKQLTF